MSREAPDGSLTLNGAAKRLAINVVDLPGPARKPWKNVIRHQATAMVIGRRAQGHQVRRGEGVTRTRPEDRVVRATDQAPLDGRQVSTRNRHRPGMRGTKSRPPGRARTRQPGRATVTPAPANNGQLHQ
jgi:hypothetical protein